MSPWTHPVLRIPTVLAAALLLLAGCGAWPAETHPYTTLHPESDFGQAIHDVYVLITWWVSAVAVIVFALMFYILVRFRDDGSPGNPKQIHGNPTLEFAWTLLPIVIVVSIAVPTVRTIFQLADAAPEDALEIQVNGKRWWWEFTYVDSGVVTANEMHIPADRPISLLLQSDTVIHSFWVPRIGGKRDLVPGRVNRIWFNLTSDPPPGQPITYLGECAEYCGEGHARMLFRVIAHHGPEFDAWLLTMQDPPQPELPADRLAAAHEVFQSGGCAMCHTVADHPGAHGRIGPDLNRYATRATIGSGAAPLYLDDGTPNREALALWLSDPDKVKPGTTQEANPSRVHDGMNLPRVLTDEEIELLIDYLLALQ